MIYKQRFDAVEAIGLNELIDQVEATLSVDDFGSMEACATHLAAYAKNPGIISGLVSNHIRQLLSDRTVAPTRTPQSFIIAVREKFYIRCNIWSPLSPKLKSLSFQRRLYSLEVPHDHNFSFLTVGYAGPGYRTDTFEYDRTLVGGRIGEKVGLVPTGSHVLSAGDVVLYRQGIDAHVQHQPVEMSASINIMFLSDYTRREWQYLFDLEAGTISGLSGSAMRSRQELIRLAAEMDDPEISEQLSDVARRCVCPVTRQSALKALSKRQGETQFLEFK